MHMCAHVTLCMYVCACEKESVNIMCMCVSYIFLSQTVVFSCWLLCDWSSAGENQERIKRCFATPEILGIFMFSY